MTNSDATAIAQFLEGVREYFHNPNRLDGHEVAIERTGMSTDGAAVILYRQYPGSPLHGLHIDLHRFAALFEPSDPLSLARIIASDEISDPGGGEPLDVDWADGLIDDTRGILWRSL
jgi:hypothetical protein